MEKETLNLTAVQLYHMQRDTNNKRLEILKRPPYPNYQKYLDKCKEKKDK